MRDHGPLRPAGPQEQVAPLKGRFERQYLWQTGLAVGGGTTEIQKNIIAMRGLGLPRGSSTQSNTRRNAPDGPWTRRTAGDAARTSRGTSWRRNVRSSSSARWKRTRRATRPSSGRRWPQQGWMGLIIPEKYGGTGMNICELVVLLEEFGRALVPGPFISTVVLGGVPIMEAGTDAQKKRVPAEDRLRRPDHDDGPHRAFRQVDAPTASRSRRRRTAATTCSTARSSSSRTPTSATTWSSSRAPAARARTASRCSSSTRSRSGIKFERAEDDRRRQAVRGRRSRT